MWLLLLILIALYKMDDLIQATESLFIRPHIESIGNNLRKRMNRQTNRSLFRIGGYFGEKHFKDLVVETLKELKFSVSEEVKMNCKKDGTPGNGRADIVAELGETVYIIELKYFCPTQLGSSNSFMPDDLHMGSYKRWDVLGRKKLTDATLEYMDTPLDKLYTAKNCFTGEWVYRTAKQIIAEASAQVQNYQKTATRKNMTPVVICGFGRRVCIKKL